MAFVDAMHQLGSGPNLINYFRPSRISIYNVIVFLNLFNYTLKIRKSIVFFENFLKNPLLDNGFYKK